MPKKLINSVIYESPEYVRSPAKTESKNHDLGTQLTTKFITPINNEILEWLQSNTLLKVAEHGVGDTYLFQGLNGASCSIHPKRIDVKGTGGLVSENHEYFWRITINYQPVNKGLPKELSKMLSGFDFKLKV